MRRAVFFDRDGVLNVDKSYLGFIKDFEWMDGAKEALAYLTAEGYAIIVVTNQSGVARGYYTEDDVKTLHDWMCREAAAAGGTISAVYYCPYLEGAPIKAYDKKSDWRKPEPGMVLALEPMIKMGTEKVRQLKNGWTVVTQDGKPAAHFEHTVAITENGPEILTLPDE